MKTIQTQQNFENSFNKWLIFSLLAWLMLVVVLSHFMAISQYQVYADKALGDFELLADSLIVFASWKLYKQAEVKNQKTLLILLASYVFCLIEDVNFAIVYTYFHIQNPASLYANLYYLPFMGYLILQIAFWSQLLSNFIMNMKHERAILLLFVTVTVAAMALFIIASNWRYSPGSAVGFLMIISGILQFIIFDLAVIALICSNNKGLYLISSATIVLMATNFWEKYLFLSQQSQDFDYCEFFWFLSLILTILGFIYLIKKQNEEIHYWVRNIRSIKSQISLWIFGVSVLSFLIFFVIGYHLNLVNTNSFFNLPFFIMIYSVLVVLFSNFVGDKLEKPFKRLQENIEMLLNPQSDKQGLNSEFYTIEFIFLQNFLVQTIEVIEERNRVKRVLADLALHVAHDIRSPVSAILMLSKDSSELPEEQRVSLREAANRINDIANNMLNYYAGKAFDAHQTTVLVSTAVLSVLSEKKFQYQETAINFTCEISPSAYFAFVNLNLTEFKRMLSNLLNNAAEAITGKGSIAVRLESEEAELRIIIKDDGRGMSQERLEKLMNGDAVASDKIGGTGLGLLHARKLVETCSGKILINSAVGKGTELTLKLKKQPCPIWISHTISFSKNSIIVILDDDASIHGAWDRVYAPFLQAYSSLQIVHFKIAEECIAFFKTLELKDFERAILLADYELIKQPMNGLDVIELIEPKRSVLVTSHFEDNEIIKRAICLKSKILPKTLAAEVKLEVLEFPPVKNLSADLVLLEDNVEFSDILSYLSRSKNKKIDIYHEPYSLLESLALYAKDTKFCFDFDINCPVNGAELADVLYKKGYRNLYLASGYQQQQMKIAGHIKVLNDKIDVIKL